MPVLPSTLSSLARPRRWNRFDWIAHALHVYRPSLVNVEAVKTAQRQRAGWVLGGGESEASRFKGDLEEVSVWHAACSEKEIGVAFKNAAAVRSKSLSKGGKLAAFWPLHSGLGCVAFDLSGGYDGLIARGAWVASGNVRSQPEPGAAMEIEWNPGRCHEYIKIKDDGLVEYIHSSRNYRSCLVRIARGHTSPRTAPR